MKYIPLILIFGLFVVSCNHEVKKPLTKKVKPPKERELMQKNKVATMSVYSVSFPDLNIKRRKNWKCDTNGNYLEYYEYNGDTLRYRYSSFINKQGKLTKMINRDWLPNDSNVSIYSYDSSGAFTITSGNGNFIQGFDKNGRELYEKGGLTTPKFVYDKMGNLIEKVDRPIF